MSTAQKSLVYMILAAGCGCGRPESPAPAARAPRMAVPAVSGTPDKKLTPKPGVDLAGPVAQPVRRPHAPGKGVVSLDLGQDRVAVALKLPSPPRGSAAPFTFGDEGEGWIARIPESNQLPTVAYGDGRIFVSGGFESTSFYSLDAQDGHMLWASQALEDNGPTAPSFQDGRVVFNTESCTLFVMDARTGRKIWFKYLGDPTLSQPSTADGLVFASHPGGEAQELTAYRIKDGDEVWTVGLNGELLAAPVIHGDSLYASTIHGRTYRIIRKTGRRVWSRSLEATTAPWIDGDKMYFSREAKGGKEVQVVASIDDGKILAEHRSVKASWLGDVPSTMDDWKKVWAFEGSRPVVVNGVRYAAMGGEVEATDPATGEAYWTRRVPGAEGKRALGTVAVTSSQIVIATRAGELYGLDVDTGYTQWAYSTGRRIVAEPVVAKGWVYAATAGGEVIALHVGDSTLDGWHMWGGDAHHNGLVAASEDAKAEHAMR